jgi:uncharacterized lipoprotein YmbA
MSALLPRITAVLVLVAAAGCVDLEPRQSNIRYYVLAGETPRPDLGERPDGGAEAGETAANEGDLVVGLRRVRMASYLDTPTIVTRMGPHEVHFGEFHRWGEDLPRAINRAVARHLTTDSAVRRVDVVPWPDRSRHDYVIQIHVLRFEGEAPPDADEEADEDVRGLRHVGEPGTVRVVAAWEIVDPSTETVVRQGTTDRRTEDWTVGDYGDLVRHLDASLQSLAQDLADAIG